MQNFLVGKCLKISQKLHGGVGDILRYVQKQKSQNQQMSNFSPYANFNCPYLKVGPCNFFPGL